MSLFPDSLFNDARFYNKLILTFFTADNCKICNSIESNIEKIPVITKYILVKVNADEYPAYFVRLTRGVIPTLTILTPEREIASIIESTDLKFIENVLRKVYEDYYINKTLQTIKIQALEGELVNDIDLQSMVYEVITSLLNGALADFRTIELYNFYSIIYPEYKKGIKNLNPLDDIARYIIKGENINIDDNYAISVALKYMYFTVNEEKLLEFINEDGSVFRSYRKQMKGMLADESIVGSALLDAYENTFDEKYLNKALQIYNYVKSNLETNNGFLDGPKLDVITTVPYIDPLANSELAIFLSRLYLITGDERFKNDAMKALKASLGIAGDNYRILARASIAYIKLLYGIRGLERVKDDIRVEKVKEIMCEKEYKYQDLSGKCYKDLKEIEFTAF